MTVLTQQDWQVVPVKNVASALPQGVYPQWDFPLVTLFYWPIPTVATLTAVLYLPTAITAFANLSTHYEFPPSYEEAILYNLAMRLSLEYPACNRISDVAAMARDALMTVKIPNVPDDILQVDRALLFRPGTYDWRSDTGG